MKQLSLLILTISLFASACEPEWIHDPIHPGLPMYTEKGVGVAGAVVNGRLWTARLNCTWYLFGSSCENDLRIRSDSYGNLSIKVDGETTDGRKIEFVFTLADRAAVYQANKESLNNEKFSIDGIINKVELVDNSGSCSNALYGKGQIHFIRVVDLPDATTNVSGTFGFEINDPNCGQYQVYYGRFDYSILD